MNESIWPAGDQGFSAVSAKTRHRASSCLPGKLNIGRFVTDHADLPRWHFILLTHEGNVFRPLTKAILRAQDRIEIPSQPCVCYSMFYFF